MGLDIYFKKTKIDQNPEEVSSEEVAYFRKVNFLVEFFKYEGNLDWQKVSKIQIEELISRCNSVLRDHNLADSALPTQAGFFFGSTDYDKYYFQDVGIVRSKMQKILKETNWDEEQLWLICWW